MRSGQNTSIPFPVDVTGGLDLEAALGFVPRRLLWVPDNAALLLAADFWSIHLGHSTASNIHPEDARTKDQDSWNKGFSWGGA